ncbi:MAG: thioesterase family protein [Myxococcota bacterium]|nr:thioesterase family protein [Myxococcota bacterium]
MIGLEKVLADARHSAFELPASFCLQDGVYGGLVLAIAISRIEAVAQHPLRSIHINFCALARPNVETMCDVTVRRRGSKTESWSFHIQQGHECVAHGSAFSGRSRPSMPDTTNITPPVLPARDVVKPIPIGPPMPPFTQHFEMRPAIGDMIVSGGAPVSGGYLDLRGGLEGAIGRPHLGALIDAWWPSFLVSATQMRPMATTSLHVTFCAASGDRVAGPFVLELKGHRLVEGYGTESNYLWSQQGQLLAIAHQSIAMI